MKGGGGGVNISEMSRFCQENSIFKMDAMDEKMQWICILITINRRLEREQHFCNFAKVFMLH